MANELDDHVTEDRGVGYSNKPQRDNNQGAELCLVTIYIYYYAFKTTICTANKLVSIEN